MPVNAAKTKLRKTAPTAVRPRRRSKHSLGGLFVTALDITGEQASEMLRRMLLIRHFEEQLTRVVARQKNSAVIESDCRFEAVAVAGSSVLEPDDRLVTSRNSHAFVLARNGDAKRAASEWASAMVAAGVAPENSDNGVISGNVALAAGTALAAKLDKRHGVALCFCTPAETQQGSFHEALNLIAAWKLPIVIVVSDAFVPLAAHAAPKKPRIFTRAQHYNLEGVMCDATSVLDVRQTISVACQRAREGDGATLIEAALPLPAPLRKAADAPAENAKQPGPRDPIAVFKTLLDEARLLPQAEAQALDRQAAATVKEAMASIKTVLNETGARR